jgi:diketogulonate reductase-like aldo/keto reductase
MERRPFGRTGREVAVIGQGTWYGSHGHKRPAIASIRHGLELGMNHIDTAEMYLSGQAEEWVGEAIAGRREEVFLVSKVLPHHASRLGTVEACRASLARLGTDYLDCYLLHWRTDDFPLAETIEAFLELEQQGMIRSWGVSNFDASDLDEVRGIAEGAACDQVLYHLQERAAEHRVISWCEQHNAAFVAYSPFGHGDFPSVRTPEGKVLKEIGDEVNATPRQVALRFLLRWKGSFVIPKAADLEHVEENARAGDLQLTDAQIARIERTFPLGAPSKALPML